MTSILKADNIQDADGNNIINESSNTITIGASGDTISIPSGATFNINGTAGTGIGTNDPAFRAYQSSTQAVSAGADTLVNFQTEDFDTGSAYDTSTMRFTPQTAGKYYLHMNVEVTSANDGAFVVGYIVKNGTLSAGSYSRQGSTGSNTAQVSTILSANGSSDYFEAKIYSSTAEDLANTSRGTFFEGYKLIGV